MLNKPRYQDAKVLLARDNFGCDSSREHAVWALMEFGLEAVIAPSFADIFHSNCFKNGLLPITLPAALVDELFAQAEGDGLTLTVDLEALTVTPEGGAPLAFEMDPVRQRKLLLGLDDIGLTLAERDRIEALRRLDRESRRLESQVGAMDLEAHMARERRRSPAYEGRTAHRVSGTPQRGKVRPLPFDPAPASADGAPPAAAEPKPRR